MMEIYLFYHLAEVIVDYKHVKQIFQEYYSFLNNFWIWDLLNSAEDQTTLDKSCLIFVIGFGIMSIVSLRGIR